MYCSFSSPTLTNCTITGNTASDALAGGGVYCCDYSSPTLTNCTIIGNIAGYAGGGAYCRDYSSPTLTNCTITGNIADRGAGVYCSSSSPTLTNCAISGQRTRRRRVLLRLQPDADQLHDHGQHGLRPVLRISPPTLTNCILWG